MIVLRLFAGALAAVVLIALVTLVLDAAIVDYAINKIVSGFQEIAELGKELAERGTARELAEKLKP